MQCKSFSHFCNKNNSVFGYKVTKHSTSWPLNELMKLTMLWTTGPRFKFSDYFALPLTKRRLRLVLTDITASWNKLTMQRCFDIVYSGLPSRHMPSKLRRTDVDATWSRRIDVSTTSFQRHVPAGWVNSNKIIVLVRWPSYVICIYRKLQSKIEYYTRCCYMKVKVFLSERYLHEKILSCSYIKISFVITNSEKLLSGHKLWNIVTSTIDTYALSVLCVMILRQRC